MSAEHSSIVLPGSGLWPLALAGVQPVAGEALRRLEGIYWYPIYVWWRRAGLPPNKAIFATEGAFERWLGTEPPRAEDAGSRRMREWVLGRIEGLASGGVKLLGAPPVPVDPEWAEKRFAEEPECSADVLFHRRWALTVLETAVEMLRAEHSAPAMAERFSLLLQFLSYKSVGDELYAAAAARSGMTAGALREAVFEFRKRHQEILRIVIADTVAGSTELDAEMNELLAAAALDGESPASAPTKFVGLAQDELIARGMRSVVLTTGGGMDWVPPSIAEAVRLFPQYEIIDIVARGGMGVVYKARQATLGRMVGIKLMPLEVSANQEFAKRFTQEATTMAHLRHPHIIAVYNFGQTVEGHLFFVMEFVEGANLHQIIHGDGLAPERALAILDNVLDALAYAHGKGVVHRDIKPANVMVDADGNAKVADFGLARLNQPGSALAGRTMTSVIMGTPDYMAPEQSRDMKVDHRADIYSLGVMLYEMLVREVPRGIFEPPSKRVAVDARLDAVVIKAMQQARDRRFKSSEEMRSALALIRTKTAPRTHAVPVPVKPAAVAKPRSHRNTYIAAGAGVAALLTAVFWPKPQPLGPSDAERALAARGLTPRIAPTPAPTPAPVSKPTPPPEKSDVAMFGDARYQFVSGALTWMEAKTAAELLDGRLATITSKEKDDFIRQTFGSMLVSPGHFVMLGGYRLKATADWQWLGDEPWSYEGWEQGEPSHAGAKAADMPVYLALSRLSVAKGGGLGWNDRTQSDSARSDFPVKCRGFILESAPDALAVRDAAEKERWKDALAGAVLPEGWKLADGVLTHPAAAVSTWQPEARMLDGAMRVAFEWTAPIAVQLGIRNDGNSMIRLTFAPAAGMKIERYLFNDRSSVLLIPEVKLPSPLVVKDTVRIEMRAVGEVVLVSVNDHVFAARDAEPKEGQPYLWIKKESVQTVSKFELLNLDPAKPVVAETKPAPMPEVPAVPVPVPTPAAPTESDTAKWLAGVDAQWQAAYQRDVVAPFEKANADLRQQYVATLDKNIAAASLATKLNEALVWRNEKVRVATQAPHDAPNDPAAPAALIQLRDTWRKNFGKVDQDRFTRAKALHVRYDALLDQNQKALTQRQRLDEAQFIKTRRDELARDWLKPALGAAAPVVAAPATPSGKLKGRDALDYLLAAHWRVVVEELGKRVPISGPEKIPHGPFEITELLTPEKVEKDAKPPTDDDLAKLAPMRGLRKFELRGAPITGAGLGFLAAADDLTDVILDCQTLTDAVYASIAGNRKVKKLTLRGGKDFTTARLAELSCIPELQALDVRAVGTFIPAAILAKARNMQQIFIERPALSADQLTALASLPELAKLSFNNCQSLPATGWKSLERSKLEHISFQNSPLVGIDLGFIAAMRKLESIEIDPADAPMLARVTGAPALRSVVLSPSRPGTDAALTAIATAFPRLESLVLGRASQPFTAVGIRALAKLSKLVSVTFTSPKVTDEQLAAIAELPAMETLRMGGAGISNEQVALLAKSKTLAVLLLTNTPLTADAAEPLKVLRGLRELDIRDTEIPPAATAELRKALPKCKIER